MCSLSFLCGNIEITNVSILLGQLKNIYIIHEPLSHMQNFSPKQAKRTEILGYKQTENHCFIIKTTMDLPRTERMITQ